MRKAWLDYLRVIAVIAVVVGHVTVDFYVKFGEIGFADWWLANLLDASLRFAVPLFVMVSGAVLLSRPYPIGVFYKKRASRLLPPLIFWNLLYLGIYVYDGMDTRTLFWLLRAQIIVDGYVAPHLWYLSMFACLMLFVPFIGKFINGEKPSASDLTTLIGLTFIFFILSSISGIAARVYHLNMDWFTVFPWYIGYFIAGYYVDNHLRNGLSNILIMTFIILLVLIGAFLNYYAISSLGILSDCFMVCETSPLVFLMTLLIFIMAKNLSAVLVEKKSVKNLAEASFGIYLVHEIFNAFFFKSFPDRFSYGLIYIPSISLLTFVLSFITIYVLRKIPIMRVVC